MGGCIFLAEGLCKPVSISYGLEKIDLITRRIHLLFKRLVGSIEQGEKEREVLIYDA